MAYTEFYCNAATGSNINAGDLAANGVVTSTNGGFDSATRIFTAASGTPFSGVVAGDWASVYLDGGTNTNYIARVVTVGGGGATLELDATAISGTLFPTTSPGASCTTGGAWKGPNGANSFPVGVLAATAKNVSGDPPRVNLKNNSSYSFTVSLQQNKTLVTYEGYTTTPGDGGKATFDAGGTDTSLMVASGAGSILKNVVFTNSASSGTANNLFVSGSVCVIGCVATGARAFGMAGSASGATFIECEAYGNNTSGTANTGGFGATSAAGVTFVRCISHDNTGANSNGFTLLANACVLIDCISESNANAGVLVTGAFLAIVKNCDFYNNTGNALEGSILTSGFYAENCNFLKNATAVTIVSTATRITTLVNCGYGSGTMANTGANVGSAIVESGKVTYASGVTPWIDPANGNFSINLSQAIGAGRGAFTETATSYTGTVSSPVIGAAQVAGSVSLPGRLPVPGTSLLPGRV